MDTALITRYLELNVTLDHMRFGGELRSEAKHSFIISNEVKQGV